MPIFSGLEFSSIRQFCLKFFLLIAESIISGLALVESTWFNHNIFLSYPAINVWKTGLAKARVVINKLSDCQLCIEIVFEPKFGHNRIYSLHTYRQFSLSVGFKVKSWTWRPDYNKSNKAVLAKHTQKLYIIIIKNIFLYNYFNKLSTSKICVILGQLLFVFYNLKLCTNQF